MSPQDQKQLTFGGSLQNSQSRPGMAYNRLPGPMQDAVQGMLNATMEESTSQSRPSPISLGNLGSCFIGLQSTGISDGANQYSVNISDGSSTVGATFAVFGDSRDGIQVVPQSDIEPAKGYDDDEEGTSRQKALQTDGRLKSKVSLTMKNATFAEVIQQLGVQTGTVFAALVDANVAGAERKPIKVQTVPLKDALDNLTALYGYTAGGKRFHYTWGETACDVMVFHFAQDPSPHE